MKDASDPELKRLRDAAVGALGDAGGELFAAVVSQLQQEHRHARAIERPALPDWAQGMDDVRGELRFDDTQYVCPIAVGGKITLCIVDTGAHRTVLDTRMAQLLGLQLSRADADYGKFSVPGSDAVHSYAGVVAGSTVLQLNGRVMAQVNNLRIISHPRPFFLLGADILRGGRPAHTGKFRGLDVQTLGVN